MKRTIITLACLLASPPLALAGTPEDLETQFRDLPMAAHRLTGPLFWMHGDANESKERLESYLDKVAAGISKGLKLVPTLNRYVGDMSDHGVFRENGVPYFFLSCGRGTTTGRPTPRSV